MKKVLLIVAIALGVLPATAQFSKADLQATGLTCALCSNAINKALLKLDFVETVKPDIEHSAFTIIFKSGAAVNIDGLKTAVEDAGFSVGSLRLTGSFSSLQVGTDHHIRIGDQYFHILDKNLAVVNGEKTFQVVDRDFVSAKQFKKISAGETMECVQTGRAGACCRQSGVAPGTRIYHVKD